MCILKRIRRKNWYLEVKCYHDSNNHHKTLKYVTLDVDGMLSDEGMWSDLQTYCLALEMATRSSILAWKAPWTEKPGSLQSTGLQSWTWLSDWMHTQMWQRSGKLLSFTSRHSALWRSPHRWLMLSSCKLIMKKTSAKFIVRDILLKEVGDGGWVVVFKRISVMEDKEKLWKCFRWKEMKDEKQMQSLPFTWLPCWRERNHYKGH